MDLFPVDIGHKVQVAFRTLGQQSGYGKREPLKYFQQLSHGSPSGKSLTLHSSTLGPTGVQQRVGPDPAVCKHGM